MTLVAFVLTKDVKHLASWTQDRKQDEYTRGAYRPICGGKVRGPMATCWTGRAAQYEDPARLARAERLPLCKHCAKTLVELVALTG
ncbi:MAG: hypothetical protein HOU01_14440, partial [Streptomycetaceae bacterium]|nr:hypothetical protein [Streptomycetaceae bacterium]